MCATREKERIYRYNVNVASNRELAEWEMLPVLRKRGKYVIFWIEFCVLAEVLATSFFELILSKHMSCGM